MKRLARWLGLLLPKGYGVVHADWRPGKEKSTIIGCQVYGLEEGERDLVGISLVPVWWLDHVYPIQQARKEEKLDGQEA